MFRLIKLEDRIVLDGNDIDIWNNRSPQVVGSDPLPGMEVVSPLPIPDQGKTPIYPLAAGKALNYDISRHIVDYDNDPITYIVTDVEALDGGSEDWLNGKVVFKGSHLMLDSSAPVSEVGKTYAIHFTADDKIGTHTPVAFTFKFTVATNTAPHVNTENPLPTLGSAITIPAGKFLVYDISPHITDTEQDNLVYSFTGGIALESSETGTTWYQQAEFQGSRLKFSASPSPDDAYKNYILKFTVSDKSASGDILNTSSFSLRVQVLPNEPPEENPDNPMPTSLHLKQSIAGGTYELKDHFTDAEKDTLTYSLTDIRDEDGNTVLWSSNVSIDKTGKLTIADMKDVKAGKAYTLNFTVSDGINTPEKFSTSLQIDPNSAPHENTSDPLPTPDSPLKVNAGQALNIDMSRYITDDENDTLTYSLSPTGIEASDGGSTEWYADGSAGFIGTRLVTIGAPLLTDKDKTYIVHFTVKDDYNTPVSFSIPIRIDDNLPPTLETPLPGQGVSAFQIYKGQSGAYPLADHFKDPDSDPIKFDNLQIVPVDGGSTAWFDSASVDADGNLNIPAPGVSEVGKHYLISFRVWDGVNEKTPYSILIVIPNRPPAFLSEKFSLIIPQNIPSGVSLGTISTAVSDPDGDTLKYSIAGGDPDHRFEINPDTGELKLVNADQLKAGDRFELNISVKEAKASGLSAEAAVIVDVKEKINQAPQENPENPKPVPLIRDVTQLSFEYDLSAHYTDPDNDTVTFGNPETLAITPFQTADDWQFALSENGILTASLPDGQTYGDYVVRFTVNDGNGGVITDAVEIRFRKENADPVVYDQTFRIREASSSGMPVGLVPASDSDGDTLSYSILPETDPYGIFSIDSRGMIRIIKPELLDDQNSPQIVLTVRVGDVLNASDDATVTIHVEKSLIPPSPQKYIVGTTEDQAGVIFIPGNPTVINAEGKSDVTKGNITLLPDNKILYDPGGVFQSLAEGETKNDVFIYTVSDGTYTAKAPVVVVVNGVNDPPAVGGVGYASDIQDTDKIAPFSGFTISDIDVYNDGSKDMQTMTIWIDHPENGRVILSDGFTDNGNGSFTIKGSAETVQQAVRNIVFEPVQSDVPFEIRETNFRAEIGNHNTVLAIDNLAAISAGSTISPSEAYSAEKVWIGTEIMIPYYGVSWKDTSSDIIGLSIEHGLPVFRLKNLKIDEFDFGLKDETENIYELVNRMLREAKLFTEIDETMYPQKYSQEITEDADRNTENWRIDIHPLEVR